MQTARFDHFQVLRGIACLMVFANHVCGLLSRYLPATSKASPLFPFIVPMGYPWVWLFLVLSGFLLTKSFATGRFTLDNGGIKRFCLARLYRLMPLLWFVTGLWFVLLALKLWSPLLPAPSVRELGIALCLPWLPYFQSTHAIGSADSPVWSAVIEVHFSLLLPCLFALIGLSAKRLGLLTVLWVLGIVALCVLVLSENEPTIFPFIYGAHLYNVGFFLAGGFLALTQRRNIIKEIPWRVIVLLAIVVLGVVQYASYLDLNGALAWSPLLMLPLWCLCIARCHDDYQAKLPSTWHELLRRERWGVLGMFETIGMMSYSLYLAHKPIVYILIEQLGMAGFVTNEIWLGGLALLCLAISLPIFAAMFVWVERRFRMPSSPTAS